MRMTTLGFLLGASGYWVLVDRIPSPRTLLFDVALMCIVEMVGRFIADRGAGLEMTELWSRALCPAWATTGGLCVRRECSRRS